jgi:lysophospholipase L1-like esterase
MWWRRIFYLAGSFCFSILLLEILLRMIDPWGAVRYFSSAGPTLDLYIPYGQRDVLPSGEYSFPGWTAHVNPDHSRFVPDNGAGACRIAFVGDSVTFGLGVNDADTWVNLVAARHPEWNVINGGVSGYNSYAVRLSIADTPADAYVYLISYNDAERQIFHPNVQSAPAFQSAIEIYARVWQIHNQGYEHPEEFIASRRRFDMDILALSRQENVLILGFATDTLAQSAQELDSSVMLLPPYTERISFADPHPNQAGHRQIAAALEPLAGDSLRLLCSLAN